MKANRLVKRSQQKKLLKQARSNLKSVEKVIGAAEKHCAVCKIPLDESDKSLLDKWMVKVTDTEAHLFCPDCFADLEKSATPENNQEEIKE